MSVRVMANAPKRTSKKTLMLGLSCILKFVGFSSTSSLGKVTYASIYIELRDYAKRKLRDPLVITNPGIPCDPAFLVQAVSNVTCVFVNFQGFDRFELPAALKAYDPARFAALPYNIKDADTMQAMVKDAIIKRIGYLYVSDVNPPTLWGKLPVYWEAEVDAVSRVQ